MAVQGPFREALEHGGRLAAAVAAYPDAPHPWIDLSTGVNPQPWPGARAGLDDLRRLPDPRLLARLEAVAAAAFGVSDPARVVATPGAEAALRWIPRLISAREIEIVSPTYGGHEQAWRAAGREPWQIDADQLATSPAEALVLVNPNNPDGRTVSREDLARAIETRSRQRVWTIVDESFVESCPELSVAGLGSDRLIVLRSFGKFYGLAGVRLGFLVAAPDVATALREAQGEWPVSAEALVMGLAAYADTDWQDRTRTELAERAEDLDALLAAAGLDVVGGTSLFRLVRTPDAAAVFDRLCKAAILTRPFPMRPDWLRFGLPAADEALRLADALQQVAA